MWAFASGLTLRLKLYALVALGAISAIGYFWLRWRIAASKAASATAQAERLEATHNLERDIALRREKLAERQAKLRAEIAERDNRDFFDGGWGP